MLNEEQTSPDRDRPYGRVDLKKVITIGNKGGLDWCQSDLEKLDQGKTVLVCLMKSSGLS
jgi:hypothetical protein